MATICKLPDSTIQLIAAGEVITKPVNVVKELLENSLDAHATNIRVNMEQGGLKLIEIIDNGHGIARANAELLCRRYATSKLSTANDLTKITTFGFRGEALASVSEMADVEVRTFNIDSDKQGWIAKYRNGTLVSPPIKKFLQSAGTHLRIYNLFGVTKSRKCAMMSNFAEEKKAIVELVTRYAIHHRDKVTISLKEGSSPDIFSVIAPMDVRPCIGTFYGVEIQNNMLEYQVENSLGYSLRGCVIFSYKKSSSTVNNSAFILFVNDRLVDCGQLKKEVEAVAHEYLSAKQYSILFYISLKVPTYDVDVNTHPAKATVKLHYQTEVVSLITSVLRQKFSNRFGFESAASPILPVSQKTVKQLTTSTPNSQHSQSPQHSPPKDHPFSCRFTNSTMTSRLKTLVPSLASTPEFKAPLPKRPHDLIHNDSTQQTLTQVGIPIKHKKRDLKLKSIHELKKLVAKEKAKDNLNVIKSSIFVGIFDHYRALIQYETKLYAINLKAFLKEQHYQFYLFDFGNFPPIDILPPGNRIKPLLDIYLEDTKRHETEIYLKLEYKTTEAIITELLKHQAMYKDYLSLNITEDEILTIPNLIPDEVPNLVYLGKFLSEMVNKVSYLEERECFKSIGRVMAEFYSEPPPNLRDPEVHTAYHKNLETKLYKAIKSYLIIPEWLFTRDNICQISDTKDLYKVFERC